MNKKLNNSNFLKIFFSMKVFNILLVVLTILICIAELYSHALAFYLLVGLYAGDYLAMFLINYNRKDME